MLGELGPYPFKFVGLPSILWLLVNGIFTSILNIHGNLGCNYRLMLAIINEYIMAL